MEHVGKHLEGKGNGDADIENLQEEEDKDLTEWAVKEGIVKDFGPQGLACRDGATRSDNW
jgi:hypothetical protein